MKTQLPPTAIGRSYHLWSSLDGMAWTFNTATRSAIKAAATVDTMRHNGRYVVIVSADSKVHKKYKPLPPRPKKKRGRPAKVKIESSPKPQDKRWQDQLAAMPSKERQDTAI